MEEKEGWGEGDGVDEYVNKCSSVERRIQILRK
jgi:hypothetical protein